MPLAAHEAQNKKNGFLSQALIPGPSPNGRREKEFLFPLSRGERE